MQISLPGVNAQYLQSNHLIDVTARSEQGLKWGSATNLLIFLLKLCGGELSGKLFCDKLWSDHELSLSELSGINLFNNKILCKPNRVSLAQGPPVDEYYVKINGWLSLKCTDGLRTLPVASYLCGIFISIHWVQIAWTK